MPRRTADARGPVRPTGPPPRRRGRAFRPLRWAWLLLLMALLAPAYDLFLPAGYRPNPGRRTVVIERGESLHQIAHELQRVGVIRSQAGFLVLARMMQLDRSVKAGQYSFRIGITVPALLRALDRGMFGLNLITIPEGLMVSETASLIERQVGIRAAAIDSLAHDPALLDSLEVSAPSLEGWLAPDSYEWLPGTSPEVVLRTMVARTRDRVQRATAGYDSLPLGMNAHEVLTLASIVESESKAEEERPRIARVYLNRLDRGMLLQADPTVGYALGRGPRSRLTFKDLRVQSSYNTYRHEGLPPGPICSPGQSAIEAVMHATPGTRDLYFVANGRGTHIFAPTYAQHLANISFVRGKAAAAAATASRVTSGPAAPDSGAGASPARPPVGGLKPAAPGTATTTKATVTGATRPALRPAGGASTLAPPKPDGVKPAGSTGTTGAGNSPTPSGALAQETPATGPAGDPSAAPLKGLLVPKPPQSDAVKPAGSTPVSDVPVRPATRRVAQPDSGARTAGKPAVKPARAGSDSSAKATRPAGTAAKPGVKRASTATDSSARKRGAGTSGSKATASKAPADTSRKSKPAAKPATAAADTSAK